MAMFVQSAILKKAKFTITENLLTCGETVTCTGIAALDAENAKNADSDGQQLNFIGGMHKNYLKTLVKLSIEMPFKMAYNIAINKRKAVYTMDFNELMILAEREGRVFAAVNQYGENMLISYDYNGGDRYFRVETAQHNGWTRINYIFEDGTREETFKRSNK